MTYSGYQRKVSSISINLTSLPMFGTSSHRYHTNQSRDIACLVPAHIITIQTNHVTFFVLVGMLVCDSCAIVQPRLPCYEVQSSDDIIDRVTERSKSSATTCAGIESMCYKLGSDESICGKAKYISDILYDERQGLPNRVIAHRPREALVASCILVAYRIQGVGRTEKEMLAICSCTKKQLSRVLKAINTLLDYTIGRIAPVSNAVDLIQRFCSHLKVSRVVCTTATHVVREIDRRGICSSRLISSKAAAAIFMSCLACNENTTHNGPDLVAAVSLASGAAPTNIREVCKVRSATHFLLLLDSLQIRRHYFLSTDFNAIVLAGVVQTDS